MAARIAVTTSTHWAEVLDPAPSATPLLRVDESRAVAEVEALLESVVESMQMQWRALSPSDPELGPLQAEDVLVLLGERLAHLDPARREG